MIRSAWHVALIALIAFVAAIAGVYVARSVREPAHKSERKLHTFLHSELKPDARQKVRVEAIEARFAARNRALAVDMRAANARLAKAIEAEHGYGPSVTAAVDDVHHVMGQMQKETLEHLFAMRAVMSADQARRFDQTVVKALTVEPQ